MTHFTYQGRWCLKGDDGYMKLYIWRSMRDMNKKFGTPGKLCDDLRIQPESLAACADFLEEHGVFGDVRDMLRHLVTPRKKSAKHATRPTYFKNRRDG